MFSCIDAISIVEFTSHTYSVINVSILEIGEKGIAFLNNPKNVYDIFEKYTNQEIKKGQVIIFNYNNILQCTNL